MKAGRPGRKADSGALAADKARALALVPVSRETEERLDRLVEVLFLWQSKTNLVSTTTLARVWSRHIADSLQLLALAPPRATVFVDLGSGSGFPALPLACALAGRPGAHVHLVESNLKKSAFLREAIRAAGVPATVHAERIEDFARAYAGPVDVVTARALAPLPQLLELAAPLLKQGVVGLFPKGQDVGVELTAASRYWSFRYDLAPSRTDPDGRIVIVRELQRAA
ncbi:MAG TPA: 16S rRNA (guanine(527)-N(7))-methyltransferase RsmG [Pseudorhodoplanes sp.]|jgi:16S rRNA (guanine527-N7)-methyltransferase|nr:16S rRNA (guanine(527)-N(7))-methyltransferase RsmG [Pseudorhodoplanes sp.]